MRTTDIRTTIEVKVSDMTVAEMRKSATRVGIKNASRYKRAELSVKLIDELVKVELKNAKRAKAKTDKRFKAEKVTDAEVEALAQELLDDIETLSEEDLMQANRKVLIKVMKMLHCSKWYRTYDKKTMVEKIIKTA